MTTHQAFGATSEARVISVVRPVNCADREAEGNVGSPNEPEQAPSGADPLQHTNSELASSAHNDSPGKTQGKRWLGT